MKRSIVTILLLGFFFYGSLRADEPDGPNSSRNLDKARSQGWEIATLIIDQLKEGDLSKFPGLQGWLKDFDKVAKGVDLKKSPKEWTSFDVDALTIRNPNFGPHTSKSRPVTPG